MREHAAEYRVELLLLHGLLSSTLHTVCGILLGTVLLLRERILGRGKEKNKPHALSILERSWTLAPGLPLLLAKNVKVHRVRFKKGNLYSCIYGGEIRDIISS